MSPAATGRRKNDSGTGVVPPASSPRRLHPAAGPPPRTPQRGAPPRSPGNRPGESANASPPPWGAAEKGAKESPAASAPPHGYGDPAPQRSRPGPAASPGQPPRCGSAGAGSLRKLPCPSQPGAKQRPWAPAAGADNQPTIPPATRRTKSADSAARRTPHAQLCSRPVHARTHPRPSPPRDGCAQRGARRGGRGQDESARSPRNVGGNWRADPGQGFGIPNARFQA